MTLAGDSLALAFWATVLLSLMMLFLTREDVERVIGCSSHWLWFSLSLNGLALFFHFCYPTASILPFTLVIISLLHLVGMRKETVAKFLPEVVSLSSFVLSVSWLMSRELDIRTFFYLPVEMWFALFVGLGIIITFPPASRIESLHIIVLVELWVRFVYTWMLPKAQPWTTDNDIFNQYWLCVFLLCATNVPKATAFHKKTVSR